MLNCRQMRREAHVEVVPHTVYEEPFPLPKEVMVVSNCGETGLGNELGQSYTERNVHRYGKSILYDHQIDLEIVDERTDVLFEIIFYFVNFFRDGRGASGKGGGSAGQKPPSLLRWPCLAVCRFLRGVERDIVDHLDVIMLEERFWNDSTTFGRFVRFPGEIKGFVSHTLQNFGPFVSFE